MAQVGCSSWMWVSFNFPQSLIARRGHTLALIIIAEWKSFLQLPLTRHSCQVLPLCFLKKPNLHISSIFFGNKNEIRNFHIYCKVKKKKFCSKRKFLWERFQPHEFFKYASNKRFNARLKSQIQMQL